MHLEDFGLSPYGEASSTPAPVNCMMAAFAADFRDKQDINLGVGYVNQNTIPADLIVAAMQQVLAQPEKYKVALNYGGPHGSPNLIDSLKRFCLTSTIGGLNQKILSAREFIIGPNGATSLLEGIARILKPGLVITSDPMYYIYCHYLERLGFEVVTVPEDQNGIRTDLLQEKLANLGIKKDAISFFYLVTINNPTCSILSNERRAALVETATALSKSVGKKIPLIFDKAYEDLVHDKTVAPLQSGLLYDDLGLVYEIGSLSKILSPALRIGYMIGSSGPFLQAMVQKTSDVGFSAPLITQEIASYLLDHHVRAQIQNVKQGYRKKATVVQGWLHDQLGEFLEACSGGKAGFYFYLTFKEIQTTETSPFFRYLARTTGNPALDGPPHDKYSRVIYVPGQFCVHPKGDLVAIGKRQLRLSYGFEELTRIKQAIGFMREAAEYAKLH